MKVALVAGEPSGDTLGAALMAGLKTFEPDATFIGVGGPKMAAEGLPSLFDYSELSVMGIAEVLPKLRHLFARRDQTAEAILAANPDVLITVDSPDFCLRVAKRVRASRRIPTVHMVAPTVWAWRSGRAARMARHVDHVLALFPFEPPYMRQAGMTCDHVGHPIAALPSPSAEDAERFRARHDLGAAPVLLVLPGSRRSEIEVMAPIFGRTLPAVTAHVPGLRVVVSTVPGRAPLLAPHVAQWPGDPILLDPDTDPSLAAHKAGAFAAADAALAMSGTVSLELAAAGTPMVIAWEAKRLTRMLIHMMLRTDTVTLVNLVSETRAVPEFLGPYCRPEAIAPAVVDLLTQPQAAEAQRAAMRETMRRLGAGGEPPGLRAARSVRAFLDRTARG